MPPITANPQAKLMTPQPGIQTAAGDFYLMVLNEPLSDFGGGIQALRSYLILEERRDVRLDSHALDPGAASRLRPQCFDATFDAQANITAY